ncbi:hypothetical protein BDQ17DRAFT_1469825 [Cyathus striatus]|nr:hypothetical protein BDQ17DRAFT_1469825 [Cyathus striatus]
MSPDLRSYLQCCALPEMIVDVRWIPDFLLDGHKSHKNHLSVQAEQWRRLETINPIEMTSKIESCIVSGLEAYIPQTAIDITEYEKETGERFSVPYPLNSRPNEYLARPTDILRLMSWVDNLSLMTVQRTMHCVFPDTQDWSFQHDNKWEVDSDIFSHFTWELRDPVLLRDAHIKREAKKKSVVIAVQPPWILSQMDMKQFSNCKSFPPCHVAGNAFPVALDSKHRVWAKIWDLCVQKESHWFVLTSYNQWVFGAFSPGWTTAFTTKVFNFDQKDPSIILHLAFWIASAMRLPGTCLLTKVRCGAECGHSDIPAMLYHILGVFPDSRDLASYTA